MEMIREVVKQALKTGYLTVEAEEKTACYAKK